jgi:secondary thiamine-phosphate synthase enzyme
MHDITEQVDAELQRSKFTTGIVTVFTPSSTSALTTIEFEPGALEDLRSALDELAPPEAEYRHNLRWGDGNGHAHLRAALMKPSLTIPFTQGRMTLGTWQQLLFIDFDVRPRERTLVVQVVGETG